MFRLVFLAVFLFHSAVFALGQERGNGGYIISCEGQAQDEFLDYYAARMTYNNRRAIPLLPLDGTAYDKAKKAFEKYGELEPVLAAKFQKHLEAFASLVVFVESFSSYFVTRDSSWKRELSPYCDLKQMIVQLYDGSTKYYVHQGYWSRISEDQKAAAMIHEIAYNEFLNHNGNYGVDDKPVRQLSSFIIALAGGVVTPKVYTQSDLAFLVASFWK
ncbi:MAG: hypothetical protein JSU04_15910 [Bdellovibrionales bacterium]|nr:hypothetical protein [Bdellovibrionales bacterium]